MKTLWSLKLVWAPGEEPMGRLEQVEPINQESMAPFGGYGAPEASWGAYVAGALIVISSTRAPYMCHTCVSFMVPKCFIGN